MKFVPEFTIIEDGDETGADDTMHAMAGHKAQTAIRSYQQGNAERQLRYAHRVFDRVAQILNLGGKNCSSMAGMEVEDMSGDIMSRERQGRCKVSILS